MGLSPRTRRRLQRNLTRDKAEQLLHVLKLAKSTSQRTVARLPYADVDEAAVVQSALDKAIDSTQRTLRRLNDQLEPSDQAAPLRPVADQHIPLMPRKNKSDTQTA